MAGLGKLHDAITRGGYQLAALIVIVIACSYVFEVVARYFFNAPTEWANAIVSYLLCAVIFLALPEQTRRRAHITITLLMDRASPRLRAVWIMLLAVAAAATCLAAFCISAGESWAQYRDGILTVGVYEIPKWWTSVVIAYGLLSSGLYFLRELVRAERSIESAGASQ
jgi:TRAP-type C4-dicarboxylate transport system permease small subunit